MKTSCPQCGLDATFTKGTREKTMDVRGMLIDVETGCLNCSACGNTFEDPAEAHETLERAYREYRRRNGMMQPEEIRHLRKLYGLTQRELAKLLGWGLVTLSRYENGALQDTAHDKILRLITDPHNLLRLLESEPEALSDEKRKKMIGQFRDSCSGLYRLERIYEERFGRYEADGLSGYRRFDMGKLLNMALFFCEGGRLAATLSKILFLADFKHFKEYAGSISGTRYLKSDLGPLPEKWYYYLTLLIERQEVNVTEVFAGEDIAAEQFLARKKADLSLFANTELLVLAFIKDHVKTWNAKMISNLIQNERGYIGIPGGTMIPYRLAADLGI